jgi:Protein of unknown function (DUF4236)
VPLRFYRRVKVIPGVSVNFSRSGPSLSLGIRGAHVTFGHGRVTRTVGIPGTGIFYTHTDGRHTGAHVSGRGWLWLALAGFVIYVAISASLRTGR